MKKSLITLYLGIFIILTSLFAFLGNIEEAYNWNFLIVWIIFVLVATVIFLIVRWWMLRKSDEKIEEKKEIKITPIQAFQMLKNELLTPEYSDMIEGKPKISVEHHGEERTPICVIKALSKYERPKEYYYMVNMGNPDGYSFITFDPSTEDRDKFNEELDKTKNLLAEYPEKVEIVEPLRDPVTGIITGTRVKRMSKKKAEKEEKEKAEEEAEAV